jgi:hypothetical protein
MTVRILRTVSFFGVSMFWLAFTSGLISAQAPSQDAPGQSPSGTIQGTATDPSGAAVAGAVVTLETASSTAQRTTVTDNAGAFRFSGPVPERWKVTITAGGFATWTTSNLTAAAGDNSLPISAVLKVAPVSEQVTVALPLNELAAQQLKDEEKQRLIGLFPHYFVTYEPNPAPLTAAQKFQLGWKTFFDPVPILSSALSAGIQQARNSYWEYGQGAEGYAKRFGANYADRIDDILIGHVVTQSLFHQDPRYFYKGTGTFGSRLLYTFETAFVCKGDNGHWQPAYSNVLGGAAAYELSTLYRPGTSRPWMRLGDTVAGDFAGRAVSNLLEEFVLRSIMTHVPKTVASQSVPILRAGTSVSLISVDDLNQVTADKPGPVEFVLASDLQVGRAIVAKAGTRAWGRATYSTVSDANGQTRHLELGRVRLTVGKADVPLRSSEVRGKDGALQYHSLEDSGRIAVVLYVDQDTVLSPER